MFQMYSAKSTATSNIHLMSSLEATVAMGKASWKDWTSRGWWKRGKVIRTTWRELCRFCIDILQASCGAASVASGSGYMSGISPFDFYLVYYYPTIG